MSKGLSPNLISDSEQLTQRWRGYGRGNTIPVSLFDLSSGHPKTLNHENPLFVLSQHEGLVAIQKVGGMTFIRQLEHPCFV